MGNKTFHRIYDFVRHDCDIHVSCRCGHTGVVAASICYVWFNVHRWPDSLEICGRHFRCSRCRTRGAGRFRPCDRSTPKSFPRWGPQSDADLKRLTARLRG